MPTFRSYMICTSPRSGSTLLCMLLKETGIAGRPDSFFHQPSLERWLDHYGLVSDRFATRNEALHAVFERARDKGTGDTGVFGLRMQQPSFAYFIKQVGLLYPGHISDVDRIEAAFGRTLLIHLHRSDTLAQAVSRVMAEQTGLWHRAADGSELERLGPPQVPRYDRAAIAGHMGELSAMNAAWEDWFAQEGVAPLRISYEGLAQSPQETLARILHALGLDTACARHVQPLTARLANATSRNWIDRFKAEKAT